jgi:hypothetical protein
LFMAMSKAHRPFHFIRVNKGIWRPFSLEISFWKFCWV